MTGDGGSSDFSDGALDGPGSEDRDSVEVAVRSLAHALGHWGVSSSFAVPAALFWVQAASNGEGVVLSLADPTGFDSDVLSELRGLLAPPEMLGVALSVPAPLDVSTFAAFTDVDLGAGSRSELTDASAVSDVDGVAELLTGSVTARLSVVLLRDATAAATVAAEGMATRFSGLPPNPVGGFLRRTVGLPSQLSTSVSLPDVGARQVVTVRTAALAGYEWPCDPALTPAGVAAAIAAAGGGWPEVLDALEDLDVIAPDVHSAQLLLSLGAVGGGWADDGVVAHDLDAAVSSWSWLASRWAALPNQPCSFADAQRDAFSIMYQ